MQVIGNYYFQIIILVAFHCWIFSWIQFFHPKKKSLPWVLVFSLLLCFLQSSYFILWGIANALSTSMVVFLCTFIINMGFVFLLFQKKNIYWSLVLSGFVFFLLILSFLLLENRTSFFTPNAGLQKILLVIHIVFFIFTYLIFSILFANNILFLIRDYGLKKKTISWNKNLPSLDRLQINNDFFINIVFLFLSISTFLSLFLITPQKNIFLLSNLRFLYAILLWFFYGLFISGKNFFLLTHLTKTKINIGLYFYALFVFFYELGQLI